MTLVGQIKKFFQLYFEFQRSTWLCKKMFTEDTALSSIKEKKTSGMQTYSDKPKGKWNEDANPVIGHLRVSGHPNYRGIRLFNRGILKKERGWSTIFFAAGSSNIFYFAQFTRQSSSVFTEQYRVSGKNSTKRFLVKQLRMWTSLFLERTTSYRKIWIRKKWTCKYTIQPGPRKKLETVCMIILNDSEDWTHKSNSVMWTMDLEISQHHAPQSDVKLWITGNKEISPVLQVKTFREFWRPWNRNFYTFHIRRRFEILGW